MKFFLIFFVFVGSVCNAAEHTDYTLYRNSTTDEKMRVHVATFDAKESQAYNKENCEIAKELFQNQKGVKAKYWCEKGRYKK